MASITNQGFSGLMKNHIGLWIDHRRAVIVLDADDGSKPTIITSHAERHAGHQAGGSTHDTRVADVADDVADRKFDHQLSEYYDAVISHVEGAHFLFVFGPGEAKGEFVKRLAHERPRPERHVVTTVTDKLTDRQVIAKVRAHFLLASPLV